MPHCTMLAVTSATWSKELTWLLLAVAFGAQAVYYLLPRARPYHPLIGTIAAGMALLLLGAYFVQTGVVSVETILFYVFSAVAIAAGGMLVTQHNPVRAALSFALVVLSTCGLFLLQAAPFLMAATIIVYAGAIVVTFLFVIMLAQQSGLSDADVRSREPMLAAIAGFVLLGGLLFVLHATYDTRTLDALLQRTEQARQANTAGQMQAALGNEAEFFQTYSRELEKFGASTEQSRALLDALTNLQLQLHSPKPHDELARQALDQVYHLGQAVRRSYGSLPPPSDKPLSPHSGVPANQTAGQPRDRLGRPHMPADNVARLGVSLFTDYLLAVELGGTLLLVATVGAIAIAGRRTEGQR